jgi:hypothetical protein
VRSATDSRNLLLVRPPVMSAAQVNAASWEGDRGIWSGVGNLICDREPRVARASLLG